MRNRISKDKETGIQMKNLDTIMVPFIHLTYK